jgi:hypothetical protein
MPLSSVILTVLSHTPTWVWGVLALLVVLGGLQLRAQRPPRLRVALLPLALGAYSAWGAVSLFGLHASVLLAWATGWGLAVALTRQLVWAQGVRHDAATDRFELPGSVWPLVLMLSVFAVRYTVVVTLAFHHDWAADAGFAAVASAAYGALSGLLAGRALFILGQARPAYQALTPSLSSSLR